MASKTKFVIYDDNEDQITYSNRWFMLIGIAIIGGIYLGALHSAQSSDENIERGFFLYFSMVMTYIRFSPRLSNGMTQILLMLSYAVLVFRMTLLGINPWPIVALMVFMAWVIVSFPFARKPKERKLP